MPFLKLTSARVRIIHFLHSPEISLNLETCLFTHRGYHDKSFGFRQQREYVFPDCELSSSFSHALPNSITPKDTSSQLKNRSENAPLLRFVDSMRTHGHHAARIDPLDLIHREEVAALSAERYGLVDEDKSFNVNGILWTKHVGEYREGKGVEWWTLEEIKEHLRRVY